MKTQDFISLADFYKTVLQDESGQKIPAPFFYFSIEFYNYGDIDTDFISPTAKTTGIFLNRYEKEFTTLRYLIQQIQPPELGLRSYSDGNATSGSEGIKDISNLFGGYTLMENSFVNAQQHSFQVRILNTNMPLVENFLYEWMLETTRTSYGKLKTDASPIPRVNMAIKFFSPHQIATMSEHEIFQSADPAFIYFFTGIFPSAISPYVPSHASSDGALQRQVTFRFNDFVIINEKVSRKFKDFKIDNDHKTKLLELPEFELDFDTEGHDANGNPIELTPEQLAAAQADEEMHKQAELDRISDANGLDENGNPIPLTPEQLAEAQADEEMNKQYQKDLETKNLLDEKAAKEAADAAKIQEMTEAMGGTGTTKLTEEAKFKKEIEDQAKDHQSLTSPQTPQIPQNVKSTTKTLQKNLNIQKSNTSLTDTLNSMTKTLKSASDVLEGGRRVINATNNITNSYNRLSRNIEGIKQK